MATRHDAHVADADTAASVALPRHGAGPPRGPGDALQRQGDRLWVPRWARRPRRSAEALQPGDMAFPAPETASRGAGIDPTALPVSSAGGPRQLDPPPAPPLDRHRQPVPTHRRDGPVRGLSWAGRAGHHVLLHERHQPATCTRAVSPRSRRAGRLLLQNNRWAIPSRTSDPGAAVPPRAGYGFPGSASTATTSSPACRWALEECAPATPGLIEAFTYRMDARTTSTTRRATGWPRARVWKRTRCWVRVHLVRAGVGNGFATSSPPSRTRSPSACGRTAARCPSQGRADLLPRRLRTSPELTTTGDAAAIALRSTGPSRIAQ